VRTADRFCWLVSILADVFITLLATAVVISLAIAADPVLAGIIIAYGLPIAVGAGTATFLEVYTSFTCDNVGEIGRTMHASLSGVQAAIADSTAELQHALARRDVLIASINTLSQQLDAIYQSNAARALDAKTLDAIEAQYNGLRQLLLTRAQAAAKLAQDAFNFERDTDTRLIKDAYFDQSLKGYTAMSRDPTPVPSTAAVRRGPPQAAMSASRGFGGFTLSSGRDGLPARGAGADPKRPSRSH
jgi:hypothetical protein